MCFDLWQWALEDERWYHLEYKTEIHVENVKLTVSCVCYSLILFTVHLNFIFYLYIFCMVWKTYLKHVFFFSTPK